MKARHPAVAVLALSLVLCLPAPPAGSQTVYRCGNTYSQSRCASGTVLDVDDARTADQKKQTDAAAQRDARAADAMEKARLKQEAHAAPAFIVPSKHPAAEKPVKAEKHAHKTGGKKKKDKNPADPFTATDGKVRSKETAAGKKKKGA